MGRMNNENISNPSISSKDKPPRIFRILWRMIIFFFILFIIITGGAIAIGYYYQDEVKEFVIAEMNKKLNTEIIVDGKDIDFTVLKNFPYASVDFKNVRALEALENKKKDTLFKAGEISFQFNITDILKKKYDVKKIKIDNVDLKIRIDKNGRDNYHIWKTSKDTNSTAFSFGLEKIILTNVRFYYTNHQSDQNADVLIKKCALSGKFSNEKYALETSSDLFVNELTIDKTIYLRKKNVSAELALNVDNTMPSYKIKDGKITIENLLFEVVGSVINTNKEPVVNFGIRGKDMDIQSVLSLIPNQYKEKIKDYESSGEFYFDATIQGGFNKNRTPQIKADFGIKNADIIHVKDNIVLHNVNLKGYYFSGNKNNSEGSLLELIPFSATIDQGSISGELSLHNLSNPSVSVKVKADISLEKLHRFVKIDTIETITGQLKIDASFRGEGKGAHPGPPKGRGNQHSGQTSNLQDAKGVSSLPLPNGKGGWEWLTAGVLSISDMNLKLKNNELAFSNINGDFTFNNNDLAVNILTGNVSSSDFKLTGVFKNSIGFILKKNQDIFVEATLNSKNIDLNELLANKDENASSKSNYKLKFSEHINVSLNSEIQHLIFRKFEAVNIKGLIKIRDKKMTVDPITLSTMDGSVVMSGLVDGTDSTKLLITCFSEFNKINISKMFVAFENFGQLTITDKNIKGITTAKVQFASVFSSELEIDMDKLYAGIDMTIDNGELDNIESLKKLSRFIELKELENIHFATFKNQFEIKNKVLTIPKMEIKSSAMNFITSGTHTFNNEINYKIKLSLNELLSKKAKKAKKENDEFGEVADDGLGRTNIFLSMVGTMDNPVIKYDSKSAVQNVRQDLKVEKQILKTILKEEFGLFKKDTSLLNKNKSIQTEKTKLTIKWDEIDKEDEKKELKKPKKKEEEDF